MKYTTCNTAAAMLLALIVSVPHAASAEESSFAWQSTSGGIFSPSQAAIEGITGLTSFPVVANGVTYYVVPGFMRGTFSYDADDAFYVGPRNTIEAYGGAIQSWSSEIEAAGTVIGTITGDSGEILVRNGEPSSEPDVVNVSMCSGPSCANFSGFSMGDWRTTYNLVGWSGTGFQDDFLPPAMLPPPGAPTPISVLGVFNQVTGENAFIISLDVVVEEVILEVDVEINPESDSNCIKINGRGVIPVAILGDGNYDISSIDQTSLIFGGLSVRVRGNKLPQCSYEYVNEDAELDLMCKFEDDASAWIAGEDEATLEGALTDGTPIRGSDALCLVP